MPNQSREISDFSDTDFEYVNLRVKLDDVQSSPLCHKVASSIAQRECNNSDIHSKTTINALENVIIEEKKMMYGSKYHALNLTKTCLNLDMFWHFCKILQYPTDGHCLLHSTISSVKSQLKPHNDLHTSYLLHLIKNEIWTNPKRYSCFIKNNDEFCLYNGFHEYAFYKRYDSKLGDLIPTIICEVLNIDLIIMEGDTDVIHVKSVMERHNTVPIFLVQNWRALRWYCPEIKPVLLTLRPCTYIWW